MNASTRTNQNTGNYEILIEVSRSELDVTNTDSLLWKALELAATDLAKTYIKDHQDEVLAKLNPQAVANLAIADSARLLREQFIDPRRRKDTKDDK
ncbi:MAG TPA: hypothetical protein VNG32_00390 [Candidatus Dormibacteraeota bacterium]|nr:hypothetical protein [Candidatus Dormibacteraeota bacterium]